MQRQEDLQPSAERPRRQVQDLPGCIKYILLLLLIALLLAELYAGEFGRARELGFIVWLILLIKIILIIGLIILIWVQRRLKCGLTAPTGCATAEYDKDADKWFVRVMGTASGTVFGSYTLSVERPPGTPLPVTVSYPGGGSSGSAPVINGELGRLDVTYIEPGPMHVVLTVHPAGAGATCVHTTDFDLMNRAVYIERIAAREAEIVGPHPGDPSEALRLVNPDPADPTHDKQTTAIADSVSIEGGADISGCGRQMVEYALQYRNVTTGSLPWQQDAPAPGDWSFVLPPLPFGDPAHPRTFMYLFGTWYNTVRHGLLTRVWANGQFLMSIIPWVEVTRPYTANSSWNTSSLNGRYTVRLVVKHQPIIGPPDPTPPELYDAATVWVDNRVIEGFMTNLGIAGGGALDTCDELSLSQFITPDPSTSAGPFSKVNATINGRAWDPIILDSYPHTERPNNNFDKYVLEFQKNASGGMVNIATHTTRVPNTLQQGPLAASPADTGVLHNWDIVGALDAGPPTGGAAPYPKIFRGERCAYLIHLVVTDTTPRGDGGDVHTAHHYFPFCIMNDIPQNVPFPVPPPMP